MGFYVWGVYLGYSMSFVLHVAVDKLGWESVYFITGIPGIIIGIIVLLTIRDKGPEGQVTVLMTTHLSVTFRGSNSSDLTS